MALINGVPTLPFQVKVIRFPSKYLEYYLLLLKKTI